MNKIIYLEILVYVFVKLVEDLLCECIDLILKVLKYIFIYIIKIIKLLI